MLLEELKELYRGLKPLYQPFHECLLVEKGLSYRFLKSWKELSRSVPSPAFADRNSKCDLISSFYHINTNINVARGQGDRMFHCQCAMVMQYCCDPIDAHSDSRFLNILYRYGNDHDATDRRGNDSDGGTNKNDDKNNSVNKHGNYNNGIDKHGNDDDQR